MSYDINTPYAEQVSENDQRAAAAAVRRWIEDPEIRNIILEALGLPREEEADEREGWA